MTDLLVAYLITKQTSGTWESFNLEPVRLDAATTRNARCGLSYMCHFAQVWEKQLLLSRLITPAYTLSNAFATLNHWLYHSWSARKADRNARMPVYRL